MINRAIIAIIKLTIVNLDSDNDTDDNVDERDNMDDIHNDNDSDNDSITELYHETVADTKKQCANSTRLTISGWYPSEKY